MNSEQSKSSYEGMTLRELLKIKKQLITQALTDGCNGLQANAFVESAAPQLMIAIANLQRQSS